MFICYLLESPTYADIYKKLPDNEFRGLPQKEATPSSFPGPTSWSVWPVQNYRLRCLETGIPSNLCLPWSDETDEASSSLSSNCFCQGAALDCSQLNPWKRGSVLSRPSNSKIPKLSNSQSGAGVFKG